MVHQLFQQAFESLPVAAFLVDRGRMVLAVNHGFEVLTGWARSDIVGRSATVLRGTDSDWKVTQSLTRALEMGEGWSGEFVTYRADGTTFWDAVTFRRLDGTTEPLFIGTLEDISDLVRLRRASEERGQGAAILLELAGRLGVSTDRSGVARALAQAVTRLGADRAAVAMLDGETFRVLGAAGWPIGPDGPEGTEIPLPPGSTGGAVTPAILPALGSETGLPVWLAPIERDGEVLGALLVDRSWPNADLHERLARAAGLAATALDNLATVDELRLAADRDPLTGLFSHHALLRRLANEFDTVPERRFVGALHLDLDRFRRVNAAFGYTAGDELLQLVAARLKAEAPADALVARYGADEFILAFPFIGHPDDLRRIADRLDAVVRRPLEVGGSLVYPTLSIGLAVQRRGVRPSSDVAVSLLRAADLGMHDEKERHRSASPPSSPHELLPLDTDLHRAVERGELIAHFQPEYDLRAGRICAFEALARWLHPTHGPVPPSVFIALAEDNGLIHQLGRQMLEQAARFLAEQPQDIGVAVNVSTMQLAEPGFARIVAAAFDHDAASLSRLVIEVTESTLVLERDRVVDELRALRELGVCVAIDDFGTGYSSLSQLQELPVTELKIDRAFVQRVGAVGASVLRAILELARGLGLRVVAEGVEDDAQLAMLRELGCDRVQGFLFAPALPADLAARLTGEEILDR